MDPIHTLISDWRNAQSELDPNADYFYLATGNEDTIGVRTMLIKSIATNGITILTQKKSNKFKQLTNSNNYEVLFWWASIGIQYRVKGSYYFIEDKKIEKIWQESQPYDGKLMDILRNNGDFHELERSKLLNEIEKLRYKYPEKSRIPMPEIVVGILFTPTKLERIEVLASSRLHNKHEYIIENGIWTQKELVP